VDSKNLCKTLSVPYLTMCPLVSRIPSSSLIVSSVIIIPSLTTLLTISGPPVSHLSSSAAVMSFNLFPVLDPRISYEGLMSDCCDDVTMQNRVERAKDQLHQYYLDNYAKKESPGPATQPAVIKTSSGSPQKVDFTARYKKRPSAMMKDELEEFYKLPQEDFNTCDPIQWWAGHRSQFPYLSHLARDILAIPGMFISPYLKYLANHLLMVQGSAVAVEHIFSGSRDTISLRRASLDPETIRALMIVKQRLRLAHTAINELLGN
jgi:hypothetical protein